MDTSQLNKIKDWWWKRRTKYNIGLLISGAVSFILYSVIGIWLIYPIDEDFEITLFTIIFQGIGFLFAMFFANAFYTLGSLCDLYYNEKDSEIFRRNLFNLGYYFSISLPPLIPIMLFIQYLIS